MRQLIIIPRKQKNIIITHKKTNNDTFFSLIPNHVTNCLFCVHSDHIVCVSYGIIMIYYVFLFFCYILFLFLSILFFFFFLYFLTIGVSAAAVAVNQVALVCFSAQKVALYISATIGYLYTRSCFILFITMF